MHKTQELSRASPPGPIPGLFPGLIRWFTAPPKPSNCIFHAFAVRKGLRPFLLTAIAAQIIFLE